MERSIGNEHVSTGCKYTYRLVDSSNESLVFVLVDVRPLLSWRFNCGSGNIPLDFHTAAFNAAYGIIPVSTSSWKRHNGPWTTTTLIASVGSVDIKCGGDIVGDERTRVGTRKKVTLTSPVLFGSALFLHHPTDSRPLSCNNS